MDLDLFENKMGLLKIIFKPILGFFENNSIPGYLKTNFGLLNKRVFWPICEIKFNLIEKKKMEYLNNFGPI